MLPKKLIDDAVFAAAEETMHADEEDRRDRFGATRLGVLFGFGLIGVAMLVVMVYAFR
jgi:hypothetical protein